MFFPRLIRWLAGKPAPYALGLLWWSEATVMLCALVGGHLLSVFLFEHVKPRWEGWLFPLALTTYLIVFYLLHTAFGKTSQLMEALVHIHRLGGLLRVERLHREELQAKETREGEEEDPEEVPEPLLPPERIRASASAFRLRYFVVLPAAILLYLLSFASTIYRIFARQIETWEPGHLLIPVFATVTVGCLCFWLLMPHLPGYVSMRMLLGHKPGKGD